MSYSETYQEIVNLLIGLFLQFLIWHENRCTCLFILIVKISILLTTVATVSYLENHSCWWKPVSNKEFISIATTRSWQLSKFKYNVNQFTALKSLSYKKSSVRGVCPLYTIDVTDWIGRLWFFYHNVHIKIICNWNVIRSYVCKGIADCF